MLKRVTITVDSSTQRLAQEALVGLLASNRQGSYAELADMAIRSAAALQGALDKLASEQESRLADNEIYHEYDSFHVQVTRQGVVMVTGGEALVNMNTVGIVTSEEIYQLALTKS